MNDKRGSELAFARAAVDTTTGHGVDAIFFDDEYADPWADRCFVLLFDTIINHETVVLPLWSSAAIANVDDATLPIIMREARRSGALEILSTSSADDISLTAEQVDRLIIQFVSWALAEKKAIRAWARYHLHTKRIQTVRRSAGPWTAEGRTTEFHRLQAALPDLPADELWFAYQTFVRAAQYFDVVGESTPYFVHPIRERAFEDPVSPNRTLLSWSWGRYLLRLMQDGEMRRHPGVVAETVCRIRELTREHGASAYSLELLSPKARSERLLDVAVRARFPVSLQTQTRDLMAGALEGGALAAAPFKPMVTYVLGMGAVLARRWKGGLPGTVARIPFIKGKVELPGQEAGWSRSG